MDKAKRAELLRQRLKAKGWTPLVSQPKVRHPKSTGVRKPYAGGRACFFGFSVWERRCQWMEQPDKKSKPTVKPMNRKGVTPVTVIAAKAAPRKLIRMHAKAEGWLSGRKLQSPP